VWLLEESHASGTRFVAVMSVAAAVMGISVSLLSKKQSTLPDTVWLILPMGSYLVTGFILYFSVVDATRGYYVRTLERSFARRRARSSSFAPDSTPSWAHVVASLTSSRRGLFGVRWAFGIGFFMFFVVLVAITIRSLDRVPDETLRSVAGVFYAVNLLAALTLAWDASFGAHRLWRRVIRHLPDELTRSFDTDARRPHRHFASYLALPRPADLVLKGGGITTIALIAGLAVVDVTKDVLTAAAICLAYELLLYQARYLANDLRGRVSDRAHPDAGQRGRFPPATTDDNERIRIGLGIVDIALRLTCWGVVISSVDASLRPLLLAVTGLTLTSAVFYEAGRFPGRKDALLLTGWWRARTNLAYAASGLGYAARAVLGIGLPSAIVGGSVHSALDATALGVVAAFMFCLGILIVTVSFFIEGHRFLPDDASPPAPLYFTGLDLRPQSYTLLVSAAALAANATPVERDGHADQRTLRPASIATALRRPWSWSFAAARTFGVLAGVAMVGHETSPSVVALAITAGLAGACMAVRPALSTTALLGPATWLLTIAVASTTNPLVVVPLVLSDGVDLALRNQRQVDLADPLQPVRVGVAAFASLARRTMRELTH
jgi:hypothetical protein